MHTHTLASWSTVPPGTPPGDDLPDDIPPNPAPKRYDALQTMLTRQAARRCVTCGGAHPTRDCERALFAA